MPIHECLPRYTPVYYRDGFFYNSVKIHHINEKCHRILCYEPRLWNRPEDSEDSITRDEKGNTMYYPPISTYDIALLQVSLENELVGGSSKIPFVASLSIDWKSDRDGSVHHIVRFDMERIEDIPHLNEQEREKWCKQSEGFRSIIDVCFDRIASTCTAHHLGWLNVPLETALFGIPNNLHHGNARIDLPDGYGTLLLTIVSSVNDVEHKSDTSIEEVMNTIRKHCTAFAPTAQ